MQTSELDYELPAELIAQHPVEPRDSSRLLVIDRVTHTLWHKHFRDIQALLQPGDLLVANDSRVIPARVFGRKTTGGKVELLLLRKVDATSWRALVGGRHVSAIVLDAAGHMMRARVDPGEGERLVRFDEPIEPHLQSLGVTPLPPYINERLADPERYQTVYARIAGSAAAPTAGLHFTPGLIDALHEQGVQFAFVTLHIGLDTFKPIGEDTVESHQIHTEWCELSAATAEAIHATRARGGRVIAVGTTSARVLETAAVVGTQSTEHRTQSTEQREASVDRRPSTVVTPWSGNTSLYITPGYRFRMVDAMITNFHLPKSTLLAMIGAFMGMDLMRAAYTEAIRERYRFFSFGDAMLIE
jgi:S-adenosylmethionine:tRNA ribosyltransferase-isomerase